VVAASAVPPPDGGDTNASSPASSPAGAGPLALIVVVAWLGLCVSLVLGYRHAHPTSRAFCAADSGCDRALSSAYAEVAGVPLAWVGVVGFATLTVAYLAALGAGSGRVRRPLLRAAGLVSLLGALAAGVLVYVQFGVLRLFCPLCTAAAALAAAVYFLQVRVPRPSAGGSRAGRAGGLALGLVIATLLGATLFILERRGHVVARIDGEEILDEELARQMQIPLYGLETQAFQLKKVWVDQRAADRAFAAEARARGVSAERLAAEVLESTPAPSETEIDAWLRQNTPALSEPERRARARHALLTARREERRRDLIAARRKGQSIEFLLPPPRVPRLDIDESAGRTDGPADAAVRLVVFSDFECPHCGELARTLRRVRDKYPAQVAVTFFHHPLETHPHAEGAALAVECAHEQGKFREFHDRLFEGSSSLDDAALAALATSLGLDAAKLDGCRKSDRGRATLRAHRLEAERLGIESVPSLFIGGRLIGGNVEAADLERMVEEELRGPWRPNGGAR